jgi:multisubunit Na+/H+ antiporter MnhG subunit
VQRRCDTYFVTGPYDAFKSAEAQAILGALLILVALCIVALFVTGAVMSMNRPAYAALLTIHWIAPVPALIAGAATISLLAREHDERSKRRILP